MLMDELTPTLPRFAKLLLAMVGVTALFSATLGTRSTSAQEVDNSERKLDSPMKITIHLTQLEKDALEPARPQGPPPVANAIQPRVNANSSARPYSPNLLGIQFPWVVGTATSKTQTSKESFACRLRYDGDFTYVMSAMGPKRPMFLELLQGKTLQNSKSWRLHALLFDPTLRRERVAAYLYGNLGVPVTRSTYLELSTQVEDLQPTLLGLYAALESVDANFLGRHGFADESILLQITGLQSLTYLGEDWTAYEPIFRSNRPPTSDEKKRLIEFLKLIGSASDEQFTMKIDSFMDTQSFLRYLAAITITSNVTGFSNIGVNDYLCLDATTNKFHLIANEFETALGSAALSGSTEQLADLDAFHPYAGQCQIVERLLKIESVNHAYRALLQDATKNQMSDSEIDLAIQSIEMNAIELIDAEQRAVQARQRQAAAAFGGTPPATSPIDPRTFLKSRRTSLIKQLADNGPGFIPALPNLGNVAPRGPSQGGAETPISNAEFLDSVKVPTGFTATLFAKSPEVHYPVAIAAEPSGAIYVASDEQGSLGTAKNGGKVLRCVDKDNDGLMDHSTEFCSVDHVRGVVYRDGNVWVCHPPFLSVFRDDNGDGVADRQQQLVTGLTTDLVNTRGGDHTTNGIRMAIDGWIYIGDGDYGIPKAKGVDGSTVVLRGGGILRVRPDGTELEIFASGLRNPFDIGIDSQLNMFTRDNTNDGGGWDTRVSQLFQSAEYGYPRLFANFSDEIMPTLGSFGGGGGTGSLFIDNDYWPSNYNKSLFTGDWGRSAVFHHPMVVNNPTFDITQEDFVSIPRATGMDIDALGNLFIASWWSGEASVYVGPHVGFVARVSPNKTQPKTFPLLKSLSAHELVELLGSKNSVARFHAQGEFLRRADERSNVNVLHSIVFNKEFLPEGRIAALFALKQIQGTKSHPVLIELLKDPQLREFAVRALTDRKTQLADLDSKLFVPYLADESPRVRAQAIISLGRIGDKSIATSLIPLTHQINEARPDAAVSHPEQIIPHLAVRSLIQLEADEACLDAVTGDHWRGALRALREMHTRQTVDGLTDLLTSTIDSERRQEVLITLIRLYRQETPYDGSWWGIRPDTTGPYYDPIEWEESPKIKNILTTLIQRSTGIETKRLMEELRRHRVELPGVSFNEEVMNDIATQPITVEPFDPNNPNQIGNLTYEGTITKIRDLTGNAEKGAKLFQSRSCNACHTAKAGERPLGPHLVDIGKRYKRDELIESILKPSEKIAQGYETQAILLESGEVVTGFVVSESGKQVKLRDIQGVTHTIDKEEIEERQKQPQSSMPVALVSSLLPEDLADLIAYLQSL